LIFVKPGAATWCTGYAMVLATRLSSANELYAHAIAIEREAAERYAEFAQHMADEGNEEVATLFRTLAVFEAEHLGTLEARTKGVDVPQIEPGDYAWLDAGAPETAAHELVFRLLTPHQALEIALQAERRAKGFFTEVKETANDPALRALAQEMAAEEEGHIAMVQLALERTPQGGVDWGRVFGD
jgi:rubrerythrin